MAAFEYRQAEEIRDAFARHGVRYLFIGKSGAILLGFPDTTQDAVLFVDKSEEIGRALGKILRDLGFDLNDQRVAEINRGKDFVRRFGTKAKSAPDAGAATVQAENKAGVFRRAAVNVGINAKGAMISAQQGRLRFDKLKIGPPHEGAVGKYPNFVFACQSHRFQDCRCAGSVASAEVRAS